MTTTFVILGVTIAPIVIQAAVNLGVSPDVQRFVQDRACRASVSFGDSSKCSR